jgi:hypothetical protein
MLSGSRSTNYVKITFPSVLYACMCSRHIPDSPHYNHDALRRYTNLSSYLIRLLETARKLNWKNHYKFLGFMTGVVQLMVALRGMHIVFLKCLLHVPYYCLVI